MFLVMVACFSIVGWWLGMLSPFAQYLALQQPTSGTGSPNWLNPDTIISSIVNAITQNADVIFTGLLALALGAFASGFLQGFSANFIVPMLILIAFSQWFLMPVSWLFDNTLPTPIQLPIVFIFNLLLVLSIVDFVRGKT